MESSIYNVHNNYYKIYWTVFRFKNSLHIHGITSFIGEKLPFEQLLQCMYIGTCPYFFNSNDWVYGVTIILFAGIKKK